MGFPVILRGQTIFYDKQFMRYEIRQIYPFWPFFTKIRYFWWFDKYMIYKKLIGTLVLRSFWAVDQPSTSRGSKYIKFSQIWEFRQNWANIRVWLTFQPFAWFFSESSYSTWLETVEKISRPKMVTQLPRDPRVNHNCVGLELNKICAIDMSKRKWWTIIAYSIQGLLKKSHR